MVHVSLVFLATWSVTISSTFHGVAGINPPLLPNGEFMSNTSVLPPGWTDNTELGPCIADGIPDMFFGPSFTDPVGLTIESCVAFCNQQGSRMAGLIGTQCRCSNIFRPDNGFETDGNECFFLDDGATGCPGNPIEGCGVPNGSPSMLNVYYNFDSQFSCSYFVWPGGAPLAPGGSWRFSYFYNDSVSARAMPRNAVNLPVPLPRGNLTVEACVAACGNAGYTLAGVEYADECYCGNVIESNSQPITTDCSILPPETSTLMPCKGNPEEFCGGPDIISIYTLPGTGLVPFIPFDPTLDGFCSGFDCVGNT